MKKSTGQSMGTYTVGEHELVKSALDDKKISIVNKCRSEFDLFSL